tara:strand:+ start:16 stop:303 length:288 start_codon:yes stop_codon:yes gene_type:complete
MSFRRAARKDANHNEITDCFISLGWSVLDISQLKNACDAFVSKGSCTIAIEIKDGSKPPSQRKLSTGEEKFRENWKGNWALVESIEDVILINKMN